MKHRLTVLAIKKGLIYISGKLAKLNDFVDKESFVKAMNTKE